MGSCVFTTIMNSNFMLFITLLVEPTIVLSSQWCGKQCYDDMWFATGEVPEKLPEVPPHPLYIGFEGRMIKPNESVDTEVMLDWPELFFVSEEPNALYSILLLDYGIPQLQGGQYVHWWIANVENAFAVDKGQEVMQYLAPFGFMRNEDETEIDQSYRGKRIHDIVALVYKQNTGRISTTEDFCSNCGYPDLVDCRYSDHNMLAEKYDMTLTAGNFFYTTYTDASDDSLCYLSKCTCTPFPYPVPGINDMPWCSC